MKYSLLLIALLGSAAFCSPLGNPVSGWKYMAAKDEPKLKDLLGQNVQGLYLQESPKDAAPPAVVVYRKSAEGKLESAGDWRKLIPLKGGVIDPKKTSIQDRVYQVSGKTHYMAELSDDVGMAQMMPATVFGMVDDGKVYLFVYENSRDIYQRNVKDVMALYHQISDGQKN